MNRFLIFLLLCGFSLASWCTEPLRFAVLANRPKLQTTLNWQPLASYLASTLGVPVQLAVYNHSELDAAVASNQADIVFTSPGHAILLQNHFNLSAPLATQITRENSNDLTAFGGVIFTRADNMAITRLQDLAGTTIATVSTEAFGAYQVQAYEMFASGIPLPQQTRLLITKLPQDQTVKAVLDGAAEVGFVRSGLLEAMVTEGQLRMDQVKIINRQNLPAFPHITSTRLYPEWPISVMPQVDEKLARKLVIALLSLPPDSPVTRKAGISGFSIPADYSGVEDLLRALRAPPYDSSPQFTLIDFWHKYQYWVALLFALGAIVTGMTITIWLQAKRTARNETLLSVILENVGAYIYLKDRHGKYLFANQKVLELWGKRKEEVIGSGDESFFDEQSARQIRQNDLEVLKQGLTIRKEETNITVTSGKKATFWSIKLPLKRPDGSIYALCGISTDITEFKQASSLRDAMLNAQSDAGIGLLIITAGKVSYANPAIEKMSGFSSADIGGLSSFIELVHPDDRQRVAQNYQRRLSGETFESHYDISIITRSGEQRYVEISSVNMVTPASVSVLVIVVDITARKQAEKRLQLTSTVFTHAREGIMITDPEGNIIEVNEPFSDITGYERDEIIGKNPRILHSGRQGPQFYAEMWQHLVDDGYWSGEMWNRRKNGQLYAESITISAVNDAKGKLQNYVALFSDITSHKEQQKQLEHIAHYDTLTNLPNRILLADRLQQAITTCHRQNLSLAVAYLDLDGFKEINDTHGHETGDVLLVSIAQRLKESVRDGDTVARIGGDEFIIVLAGLESQHECEPILARLLQAASDQINVRNLKLRVSASIGVTFYPYDGVDADVLIRHADHAMYQAKQSGKNRYHFFDIDQDTAVKALREKIDRIMLGLRNNEFVMYYQPKVNMKTGEIIGTEALIRWQHPEQGLLPPAAFLPIIENHPINIEVGTWVMNTVLTQLSTWKSMGINIPVSINIGAQELQHREFLARLTDALKQHPDLTAGHLELEILETSALADIDKVSELMHACREQGVRFSIDDFGTGYSSLTYLKRLPVDVLKIDQSFIRNIPDDTEYLAIVEGIISLATAFRRTVIAEGVETATHGDLLLMLGCELAQGYGIAKPMPASELPPWINHWKPVKSWSAWRERSYSRTTLTVAYAEAEHRHWIRNIETSILDTDNQQTELDTHDFHFARWLDLEGPQFSSHPDFPGFIRIYNQVHELGWLVHSLQRSGLKEQAKEKLPELLVMRDQLISQLRGWYAT